MLKSDALREVKGEKIEEKNVGSIDRPAPKKNCPSQHLFVTTETEAIHMGIALIQAASFHAKDRTSEGWGDIPQKTEIPKEVEHS